MLKLTEVQPDIIERVHEGKLNDQRIRISTMLTDILVNLSDSNPKAFENLKNNDSEKIRLIDEIMANI